MSEANLGPTTTGTSTYDLDDISVATDSGWREIELLRVEALTVDFMAGKYGTGNFCKPSVIISGSSPENHDTELRSDLDGCVRLDNGKSTIKTLKDLKVALHFTSCLIR